MTSKNNTVHREMNLSLYRRSKRVIIFIGCRANIGFKPLDCKLNQTDNIQVTLASRKVSNQSFKLVLVFTKPSFQWIKLISPHMGGNEQKYVKDAFDENWIAPLGPNVNGFEADIQDFA